MKSQVDSLVQSLENFMGDTISREELTNSIKVIDGKRGDLAFPCFRLAKELYQEGDEVKIAEWVKDTLDYDSDTFESIENVGPYVNFRVNKSKFVRETLEQISSNPNYGSLDIGKGKKVIVDYSAPNIGKPLHIGHIRSTILGDSIIKIMKKAGYDTHGINYLGDAGLHLGKVIHSFERDLDEEAFKKAPDRELLRLYVEFGEKAHVESSDNPDVEDGDEQDSLLLQEAKDIVRKMEEGDEKYLRIYDRIHEGSMQSFDRVYDMLDVEFDEVTGQSKFSDKGKKIVQMALDKGFAEIADNNTVVVNKLKDLGLPPKVILRSDGSAIYATQDLGAAYTRHENHNFDKLFYVVAEEQNTYFKQLFGILKLLGNDWAENCQHLTFGMINLADEKMSSRKGNVVFLEDVLNKSVEKAESLIRDDSISDEERHDIAKSIGIGAIKYMTLGVEPIKNIKFSWERALDLNANTSPYIQYAYARANRLTEDASSETFNSEELVSDEAFTLVKKLSEYSMHVERAASLTKPNLIASYAFDLAKSFNKFYANSKVIGSEEQDSRLYLTKCFKQVVSDSLSLLGISMPERM